MVASMNITLTWLFALAELAISRFSSGTCDLRNGNTYGLKGKLTDSCKACLKSSIDTAVLCFENINNKKVVRTYY